MSIPITFNNRARLEYLESIEWYYERSTETGVQFKLAVKTAIDEIAVSPERVPITFGTAREYAISGFPFSIVYRVKQSAIRVIAVYHHSRDPLGWKYRK